ncbi:uncharacterized protein LOC136081334 [Hydra vulgaris]|uniref:Uncharacterized protein LOC136081334 n=1 Tax=Hydra vulgaris TaxID=6087 RepID=A0ABM4BZN9_HYDVU
MGLVPIILEKLPEELNLVISRKLNEDRIWEIKDVLDILKSELRAREHINSSNSYTLPFTAGTFHSRDNPNSKYDKKTYIYKRNDSYSPVCLFCDNHKSHHCKLVTNITARKKILSDKKCCFRCLSNKYLSNKCSSKLKCFKCNRFHRVSIYDNRDSDNNDKLKNNKDGELTSVASTSFLSASKSVLQPTETVVSDFNREQIFIKNDLNLSWDDFKISESDNIVYENFQKNIKFNGAMYEVELPFKIDHPVIGDNYNLWKSRFLALEKKLASDRDLFASYNNIIKDQLSKGIIEKISNFESNIGDVHYLPHRPVIREDKLTSWFI